MSVLTQKKILLAVSGGIAAYKTAFLVRLLIQKGATVKVILTSSAKEFVSPLTLSVLSQNPVHSQLFDDEGNWVNHVEYGLWADVMIVAPATAHTLSKMAHAQADNLVLATYLSAKCPVFVAPAMDLDMYAHPANQENILALEQMGNFIIPAEEGELASGLVGKGRMAEPEHIITFIENQLKSQLTLANKKILITAGPTYENLDPVRFIGNYSSGKMGYEIAKEASRRGAEVILISGPSHESVKGFDITLVPVVSAQDMLEAVQKQYDTCHVAIMSAAVADYRPKTQSQEKIKKKTDELQLELVKNPDILQTMGNTKKNQILVGFALETHNEKQHAIEKLQRKNLDLIVLNSLQDKEAGFQKDTNKITLIDTNENATSFPAKPKWEVAQDILNTVEQLLLD